MNLYEINVSNNGKYDTMFDLDRDTFWKMFLRLHDISDTRADFAKTLGDAILESHGKNPATTSIILYEGIYWNSPRKPWFKWTDGSWGDGAAYHRYRRACAKYFGVKTEMIEALPLSSQSKSDLQAYFVGRKSRKNWITEAVA